MKNLIGREVRVNYYDNVGRGFVARCDLAGLPCAVINGRGKVITYLTLFEMVGLGNGKLTDLRLTN